MFTLLIMYIKVGMHIFKYKYFEYLLIKESVFLLKTVRNVKNRKVNLKKEENVILFKSVSNCLL